MQTSKPSYYNVEAFHNNGQLVIQFMPEYLRQIKEKIAKSGFSATPETTVECFKYSPPIGSYLNLNMQRIEIDYSNQAVDWFLSQDWQPTS